MFMSFIAIMFIPFIATENLQVIWLHNLFILMVPGEGHSKKASCALILISTILFLSMCPYHGWCTISPQEYHPHKSMFSHWHGLLDIFIIEGVIMVMVFNATFKGWGLCCLTPLSTIFQLNCGDQCCWWRKPEKVMGPSQITDHKMLYRAHLAMSVMQAHNFCVEIYWLHM
jgi:hypothetical protein